ncbi:MAG: SGNH/GDSL hydrolase family protein, partial [Bdellovibrionales bacterium]|nr:SGNH/GDSL hydrolase family protein [Bdellovibrionales bacterium]
RNKYSVQIPSNTKYVRLDPQENAGAFKIHSLYAKNFFSWTVQSWDPEGDDEFGSYHMLSQGRSPTEFESHGIDPYMEWKSWSRMGTLLFNFMLAAFTGITLILIFGKSSKKGTATSATAVAGQRSSLLFPVVTVGGALALGLPLVELAFRRVQDHRFQLLEHGYVGTWERAPFDRVFQWPHRWRGETQKAPLLEKEFGTFSFRLNKQGYRGEDWETSPDGKSVLFLGDSYTFGWGVRDAETFPAQIKAYFQKKRMSAKILNAGVPGYGTFQELAVLKDWIESLNISLVVLSVVMNDAQPPEAIPLHPEISYRYASSWVLSELREYLNSIAKRTLVTPTKFRASEDYNIDFRREPNFRSVKDSLKEIRDLCEQRKIPLLVTILPDFTNNFNSTYAYRGIHEKVMSMATELGIEAIDMLPLFEGKNSASLRVPGDGHPNAEAHRLIAKYLLDHLNREPVKYFKTCSHISTCSDRF